MNSKQAKALTNLVKYNFLVSLIAVYTDYTLIKISYAQESDMPHVVERCKPCKTEVSWDGTYIFAKIYGK